MKRTHEATNSVVDAAITEMYELSVAQVEAGYLAAGARFGRTWAMLLAMANEDAVAYEQARVASDDEILTLVYG